MAKERDSHDAFAHIAAEGKDAAQNALIEPGPPNLPRRFLPCGRSDPTAQFAPLRTMASQDDLSRTLKSCRRRYAGFVRNLAPTLRSRNIRTLLRRFQWREETDADRTNPARPLEGAGRWQSVRIPHYGGPLGRAAACYRSVFRVTSAMRNKGALFLRFKGVDYKAHVFVNGTYLGSHEGFFAPFEFEFTRAARLGANTLLVKVENDAVCMGNDSWGSDGHLYEGDKLYAATGPGYDEPEVGWHHCPPGMGIYQDVCVEARRPIHFHDMFVRPDPENESAEAWVEVFNCTTLRHDVTVEISVFGQNFRKLVFENRKHTPPKPIGPTVNYFRIPFKIPKPRLWEPETPWLYQLQATLRDKRGRILDTMTRQFGMRSFQISEDSTPKGWPVLNGRKIRLRGANTMSHLQQCVIKRDWKQLRDDILLAKICNMNFLRLTQRPVQPEIYEMCDRLGLMTQTDLPLFGMLRRNQFCEAVRQAGEMERLVRKHPCNVLVSFINEPFPNARGRPHRHLLRPEMESFFEAASRVVRLENPDRAIKPVDGDYDPPHAGLPDNHCYTCWYNGHGLPLGKLVQGYWQRVKPGWNYACGEFGAEGLDPVKTMLKYYPKGWLPRSPSDLWSPSQIPQSQTSRFHYLWFTTQQRMEDWVAESQRFQAWATRIMTEAFRRDERMVSCAIHLFIDAFPSGWMKAIMDVDRNPKPAYFAYRDALAPVAANIRSHRNTYFSGEPLDMDFWICNDRPYALQKYSLCYQVRQENKMVFSARVPAYIPPLAPRFQGKFRYRLPVVATRSRFSVELAVKDPRGRIIHDTAREVVVFPRHVPKRSSVHVLGDRHGPAWNLALELGLRPVRWNGRAEVPILADSLVEVRKNRQRLEAAIRAGARVVLTDFAIPQAELDAQGAQGTGTQLKLAGAAITFHPAGMNPAHFVNCSTGHPLVHGFEKDDFFLWHNSATDMIDPILLLSMEAEGMEPILLTGTGSWGNKEWKPAFAAATKALGRGLLIVSLVSLNGRTRTNPVAREYALRILGLSELTEAGRL